MKFTLSISEFFSEALETTSILHVLVLVYLRLFAIRKPLCRENHIIQLRKKLIILIWTLPSTIQILRLLSFYLKMNDMLTFLSMFVTIFLEVVPFISIIVMYCLLVRTLEKKKLKNRNVNSNISNKSVFISNYDKTTLVVKRLVCFLLVIFTPYLILRHHQQWVGVICSYSTCDSGRLKVNTI